MWRKRPALGWMTLNPLTSVSTEPTDNCQHWTHWQLSAHYFLNPHSLEQIDMTVLCGAKETFSVCTMKAYGRSGVIAPIILDLGSRWRWVVNFMLRQLNPGKRHHPLPRTHWIWCRLSNLDILEMQKSLVLPRDRSPDYLASNPGTIMNKVLLLPV